MMINDRPQVIVDPVPTPAAKSTVADLELIYQAINRLGALVEQYDMLDQSYAQLEMQREILDRVPNGKTNPDTYKQLASQLSSAESHRDAVIRAIREITGKQIGELRQSVTDLKLALGRYSEVELEYLKTKQAFEILASSDGFSEEEGNGDSRKEYEVALHNMKQNREFVIIYMKHLIKESLNRSALVTPRDSVLSSLIRSGDSR